VPAYVEVNGEKKSIYVDEQVIARLAPRPARLHQLSHRLQCRDASGERHRRLAEDGQVQRLRRLPRRGRQEYQQSFHGNLVLTKDASNAPLCADCHDAHNIVPPGTPEFRKQSVAMCTRCHGGAETTYLDSYHGKAFTLGDEKTAACYDCHGGHRILPPPILPARSRSRT